MLLPGDPLFGKWQDHVHQEEGQPARDKHSCSMILVFWEMHEYHKREKERGWDEREGKI
jgi:hypothetical protein